jgi:hypothetical protein
MATILQPIDFTDIDAKNVVSDESTDYVNDSGDNVYLALGDEYLTHLHQTFNVDPLDTNVSDPIKFKVKQLLLCFVKIRIFTDLINDALAPFEGQQVVLEKYRNKLDEAKLCHKEWYSQIDENAFYDEPVGYDNTIVTTFGRR